MSNLLWKRFLSFSGRDSTLYEAVELSERQVTSKNIKYRRESVTGVEMPPTDPLLLSEWLSERMPLTD